MCISLNATDTDVEYLSVFFLKMFFFDFICNYQCVGRLFKLQGCNDTYYPYIIIL
jgi:uncharacterized iron-regulated protein